MNQDSRDAMDDIKKFRHKTFEELRHETEDGGEYWSARELYPVLEYSRWEKFEQVIERAILSRDNSGHRSEAHFHRAVKMAHIGLGKQKETSNYHISRYGCYLVIQNGDPSKPAFCWTDLRPPKESLSLRRNVKRFPIKTNDCVERPIF